MRDVNYGSLENRAAEIAISALTPKQETQPMIPQEVKNDLYSTQKVIHDVILATWKSRLFWGFVGWNTGYIVGLLVQGKVMPVVTTWLAH